MVNLLEEFDRLLQEKTFSVDAVEGIVALKRKVEAQASELQRMTEWKDRVLKERDDAHEVADNLRGECSQLKQELSAALVKIESMTPAHHEAEKHKAVSAAYKFCLETVFKPVSLRRTVQESVVTPPPSVVNGMNYYPAINKVENTTIETEE